jgi:hypothetical protein
VVSEDELDALEESLRQVTRKRYLVDKFVEYRLMHNALNALVELRRRGTEES